ncbi:MAG: hypothetical protein AAB263_05380 [Planctomycetota bacterium]
MAASEIDPRRLIECTAQVTAGRRRWAWLAAGVAAVIAAALALVVADVVWALEDGSRSWLARTLVATPAVGIVLLLAAWRLANPTNEQSLRLTEVALDDHDRRLTAACELSAMPGVLAAAGARNIVAGMNPTVLPTRLPPSTARRWIALATTALAIAALAVLVVPRLGETTWARFSDPDGDHPPWARVQLTWSSAPERVRSGDAARFEISTDGDLAVAPVLVADGVRLTMFPLGAGRWGAELARVEHAQTVWVEGGGTRTKRRALSVDPVPVLSELDLAVESPRWSGLEPETRRLKPGSTVELAVLPGSRLKLRPQANRPLAALRVVRNGIDERKVMSADGVTIAALPGSYAIVLEASDGIVGASVPICTLTRRDDQVPRVAFTMPSHDAVATPGMKVAFTVEAEDDLGLAQVVRVTAVNGLEAPPLRQGISGRRWHGERSLDLTAIGAKPGDLIVLGVMVRDCNPELGADGYAGQTSAWAQRSLRVIDEEEYNRMVRQRLGVNALERKYAASLEELKSLEAEAAAIRAAMKAGADPQLDARMRALAERARKLQENVRGMRRDKPLFDIETDLQRELDQAANELAEAAESKDPQRLPGKKVGEMLEQDLAHMADLARGFGLLARLRQLIDAEQNTTERLSPLADHRNPTDVDRVRLRDLAEQEEEIAKAIDAWQDLEVDVAKRLREHAPEDAQLLDDLSKALADTNADTLKRQAATAARAGDGAEAFRLAALARDRLLELLPKAGQCQGGQCSSARLSLKWCSGNAASQALGLGFGFGGSGGSGVGDSGLGLVAGYGGDDRGNSQQSEGMDLYGPEALGEMGGGQRGNGDGIAELAAAGNGGGVGHAAAYGTATRTTKATDRSRLSQPEEHLVGDYFLRLEDKP